MNGVRDKNYCIVELKRARHVSMMWLRLSESQRADLFVRGTYDTPCRVLLKDRTI